MVSKFYIIAKFKATIPEKTDGPVAEEATTETFVTENEETTIITSSKINESIITTTFESPTTTELSQT